MANSEHPNETTDKIFAGTQLICRKQTLLLNFMHLPHRCNVFHGVWKEKEVAVRRIEKTKCLSQWGKMVARHESGSLNHENVLKILGFEDDTIWRYFALEQYHDTLEDICRSSSSYFSNAEFLLQMANGINYIHSKGLVHGNLNPNTVLLAYSIPRRVKISEFGLTNLSDSDSATESDSGESDNVSDGSSDKNNLDEYAQEYRQFLELSHPKYWRRADSSGRGHKDSIPAATVHGDVFAAGCLFFYLLTLGSHPFGRPKEILTNIYESKPVNLKKLKTKHFAYQSIKNMIGKPPTDGTQHLIIAASELAEILPLNIDESKKIGRGAFGFVFEGTYQGNKVAVKRISTEGGDIHSKAAEIAEAERPKNLNHENVLKLLHVDYDTDQRYLFLVLELCAGTLEDCVTKGKKGFNLPPDAQVLYQIANGLDYIHSRNLVHRDIKPENILISLTRPTQMKISDFGFCKNVSLRGSFSQSTLKGTQCWMAPEMLEIINQGENAQDTLPRGTIQSDTYSAGCVFFYFLTDGYHPFGMNAHLVPANVLQGNSQLLTAGEKLPVGHFAFSLIEKMIRNLPERITLPEVMMQLQPLLPAPKRKFRQIDRWFTRDDWLGFGSHIDISRFHPIELVLACGSRRVRILKAANLFIPFSNWKVEMELFESSQKPDSFTSISSLEWSSDGTKLAVGQENGLVMIWRYPSGDILVKINKNSSLINYMAWNPFNNDILAVIDRDSELSVWDLSIICKKTNEGGDSIAAPLVAYKSTWMVKWISENRIAFPRPTDILVVELYENIEAKTQVPKSDRIEKWFCHQGRVSIEWNQAKRLLFSYSPWGTLVKVWSMDMGSVMVNQPLYMLEVPSSCNCLALRPIIDIGNQVQTTKKSRENIIIACGLVNGDLMIWNPLEKSNNRVLEKHSGSSIISLAFTSDGQLLASTDSSTVIIWCAKTWNALFFAKTSFTVFHLSWLPVNSSRGTTSLLTYTPSSDKITVIERR